MHIVVVPEFNTTASDGKDNDGEDEICCTDEDKIGECVLDGKVDAGAIGDVDKSEQGEDEAEGWDLDEREVGVENVVAKIFWNYVVRTVTHTCHADATEDTASYGKDDIHKCEFGGEGDERFL